MLECKIIYKNHFYAQRSQLRYIHPLLPMSHKKKALANSVDSDQMPQNAASDQGLHYLL